MKPEKFMPFVKEICNMEATDCRSLNKSKLVRELMNLVNIPRMQKSMKSRLTGMMK